MQEKNQWQNELFGNGKFLDCKNMLATKVSVGPGNKRRVV